MAILTDDTINQITKAVKTAKIFGIESFIIEQDKIRGIDKSQTVAIFDNITFDIEHPIGVNRLDILINRLTLFGDNVTSIECVIDDRVNETHSLIIKTYKAKVEYKCAKIRTILAPKSLQVSKECKFVMNNDLINMILKADIAMKAETLNILCNDDVVTYEFIDSNNDVFQYESDERMLNLKDDNIVNLAYRYPIKLVILAIKHNTTGNFYITNKGMFNTDINGINVYIPSKQ
jgi:hypothetical protein